MLNTYEDRLKEAAEKAVCRRDFDIMVDHVLEDIFATDSKLYSIDRRWKDHGTWEIILKVNEYVWGKALADHLHKECRVITHDEEKEFRTLGAIRETLIDAVESYAFDLFD